MYSVISQTKVSMNYIPRRLLGSRLLMALSLYLHLFMDVSLLHSWHYYNVDHVNSMLKSWILRNRVTSSRHNNNSNNQDYFG